LRISARSHEQPAQLTHERGGGGRGGETVSPSPAISAAAASATASAAATTSLIVQHQRAPRGSRAPDRASPSPSPSPVEGRRGGRRTPASVAEGREQASASAGRIGMGSAGGEVAGGEARHLKSSLNNYFILALYSKCTRALTFEKCRRRICLSWLLYS
jgi:hypothetical protein